MKFNFLNLAFSFLIIIYSLINSYNELYYCLIDDSILGDYFE